ARGCEVASIPRSVRYVIFMAEEHVPDAAHPLEGFDQTRRVPRRIHQPIAVLMTEEIAVGAERLLGIEPVVVDVSLQMQRKALHRPAQMRLIFLNRADGPNRTGE